MAENSRDFHELFQRAIAAHVEMLESLLACDGRPFDDQLRTILPARGGVYWIGDLQARSGQTFYLGQTKNLRRRILGDHVNGDRTASTLKRKLIATGTCIDEAGVAEYLRGRCRLRFIEIPDARRRLSFEHFAVSVLDPAWNDLGPP